MQNMKQYAEKDIEYDEVKFTNTNNIVLFPIIKTAQKQCYLFFKRFFDLLM